FPLSDQSLEVAAPPSDQLGQTQGLVRTDENAKSSLVLGDFGFETRHLLLNLGGAFLHLPEPDRIQAPGGPGLLNALRGGRRIRYGRLGLRRRGGIGDALLAPQVVLVVARIDLQLAVADFEDASRELVEKITVVRDEDHCP